LALPAAAGAAPSVPLPAAGTAYFGVTTDTDLYGLSAFESAAGRQAGLFQYYRDWRGDFDRTQAEAVRQRGMIPIVTWEPWDWTAGVNQPNYTLARIANGAFDAYIRRWAQAARAWGKPIMVRFAHEMNGTWYPWAQAANGNRAGDYVRAWRRVVSLFSSSGAGNVAWIWSPNVSYYGSTPLSALYPGDAYVDWIGIDGYNFGTIQPMPGWQAPSQVFGATLSQVRALTRKPIIISETAAAEAGGDKASWIRDFAAYLLADQGIRGFLWFNHDKETDWRIQSSPSAQSAFAALASNPRYRKPGT
jgi:hypothetical protein